jgi:hypothetical protein
MAECYEVGRSYTKRVRTRVTDPHEMRALMTALAASDPTAQGRLADLESRAIAHLKRAKMPLDPNARPYGDRTWLRENERRSLDWYAIQILNTIRILRKQVERRDVWLAVDLALDLGVLATEAMMIQHKADHTSRGGQGFKTSDKILLDIPEQRVSWRVRARELWVENPRRKQTDVAKQIKLEQIDRDPDPKKHRAIRTIVRAIRDLDPKKLK